ncbi:unnamed protein product [Cuscuta epithymum]|uniref:Uncharacterized protein n=1 Tax=Cuscuta epithymum TaxID=186058 RepID=A0AAV0EN21_9ASTE|nr:unnamed protein product [Cuscuta epithymum]
METHTQRSTGTSPFISAIEDLLELEIDLQTFPLPPLLSSLHHHLLLLLFLLLPAIPPPVFPEIPSVRHRTRQLAPPLHLPPLPCSSVVLQWPPLFLNPELQFVRHIQSHLQHFQAREIPDPALLYRFPHPGLPPRRKLQDSGHQVIPAAVEVNLRLRLLRPFMAEVPRFQTGARQLHQSPPGRDPAPRVLALHHPRAVPGVLLRFRLRGVAEGGDGDAGGGADVRPAGQRRRRREAVPGWGCGEEWDFEEHEAVGEEGGRRRREVGGGGGGQCAGDDVPEADVGVLP